MKATKVPPKMDPVMRAIKAVHSVAGGSASVSEEDLAKQRASQELFGVLVTPVIGVSNEKMNIDGMAATWWRPDFRHEKRHVILYCHGGGYTAGNLAYAGILASKLSLHTGLESLAFEYRLAPEHPYPAALEDAKKAWDYLMKQGYAARDVIVAGDSAGGNMALELCLRLREEGRMLPKALVLMSPWTDMTVTSETYETHLAADPMITPEYVRAVRGAYLGDKVKEEDFKKEIYSPLFADLTGFPETYIQVGNCEVLLDDSRKLYEKMKEANVKVKLDIYDGAWHVFQQMPMRRSIKAVIDIGSFVERVLR
ncbi:MAG: alpha/beta hydrolase [Lachnospiraceae bacterium]|nr:alpha/beta hydrolase [Lachnospiraceae bacterium]